MAGSSENGGRSTLSGAVWRWSNLTIAFLLELGALATLASWGYRASDNLAVQLVLAVGAPLIAATLWGLLAAPRARRPAPLDRIVAKVTVFGSATMALFVTGHSRLAITLAVLALVNSILVRNETHQP